MTTPTALLAALRKRPLPYDLLRSPPVLRLYPAGFDQLLKDGENAFRAVIRQDASAATFSSVVEATLEIGRELIMLWTILNSHHHTSGNEDTRLLVQRYQPRITAFGNTLSLSPDLYRLLKIVRRSSRTLTTAQRRSLFLLMRGMEVAGVHLLEIRKRRLKVINLQLAALEERFNSRVTASRRLFFHHFTDDTALADIPAQEKEMAKREAKERGLRGYVFTLSPPSYVAILRYCSDRAVRRMFMAANHSVATTGKSDNRPLILRLLSLRQEKARLLGYRNFAEYIIDDRMAKTPAQAFALVKTIARVAKKKAQSDLRELTRFSKLPDIQLWDVPYYAQKLRRQRFDVDENALKEHFPLDRALEGSFYVAERLFGLSFHPLKRGKEVMTYEVRRGRKKIGEFLLDLFARPAKRPGAWSDCLAEPIVRNGRHHEYAVAMNVASFGASAGKGPPLLRHGDVVTLFHEFGHALHNLLCDAPYRNLHSFHVEWDFVELPSQLLEHWCWDPASLRQFALHHKTGKPIPTPLLHRLRQSRTFLQGIDTLGQADFAMLDLLLHFQKPPRTVRELERFCRRVAERYSVLPIPDFHKRFASFQHIFAGGYCAAYYSYLWAEALEADVAARFEKQGFFNRRLGEKLRREILSVGAARPGMASFRAFMGRKPDPRALLRKRGLV